MKKLFILAAAIVAFASCSKPVEPQTVVAREIQFASTPQTRATEAPVVDENVLIANGFAVWGFVGTTEIFNKSEVAHNGKTTALDGMNLTTSKIDGAFSPVNAADVKYWSAGQTYMFSAMAPKEMKDLYTYKWNGTTNTQTITNFENDGLTDLIVAEPAKFIVEKEQNQAVNLHFNHMLSRIRFSFTNQFVDDNVTIEISNLKIDNTPISGTANIVYTPAEGSKPKSNLVTWEHTADKELNFYDATETEATTLVSVKSASETNTNIVGYSVYRYIIPGVNDYKISFDLTVKADNQIIATNTYEGKALPTTDVKSFEAGKGYVFNANINIDQAGQLYPIQWTVSVEKWGDDVPGGDITLN